MTDLSTPERLARAATPYCACGGDKDLWCDFHKAVTPDVILALVARVRELEQAVREQNPAVVLDSGVSVLLVESLREESKKLVARARELEAILKWFIDKVERDKRHGNVHPGVYNEIAELAQSTLTPLEPQDG